MWKLYEKKEKSRERAKHYYNGLFEVKHKKMIFSVD